MHKKTFLYVLTQEGLKAINNNQVEYKKMFRNNKRKSIDEYIECFVGRRYVRIAIHVNKKNSLYRSFPTAIKHLYKCVIKMKSRLITQGTKGNE